MIAAALRRQPDLLPSLAAVFAAGVWGLFWLPLRDMGARGIVGPWASLGFFVLPLLIMLPLLPWRYARLRAAGPGLWFTGLLSGAAFVLYAMSLLQTDVVRALLLFYLTPVWSTLLGCLLLGERLTLGRVLAIAMGLAGLLVILGIESGFPLPHNAGDWMGLVAGVVWAYASLRVHQAQGIAPAEQSVAYFIGGTLCCGAILATPLLGDWATPAGPAVIAVLPWLIPLAALLVLPSILLVFWGALRLSPGRLGILFMAEVVVGVTSAAILTAEPFGTREVFGTLLIGGAGMVEVLWPRRGRPERGN